METNKVVSINFKEVEIKDLAGTIVVFNDLHEKVGNQIYKAAQSVPVAEAARKLYYGESAEVNQEQLEEITTALNGYFIPLINASLNEYITEKLIALKSN